MVGDVHSSSQWLHICFVVSLFEEVAKGFTQFDKLYPTEHDILATYFTVHTVIVIMAIAWTIGPCKDM